MKDKALIELVVVLILVGLGLWYLKNPAPVVVDNSNRVTPADSVSNGNASNNVFIPAKPITYAQALQIYKDVRIQLNQDCQATPNNVTHKNNTYIMIDNRADKARIVKVGSSFSVPAYGFQIVKLSSASLPATWYVDCGSSQNVATILIQK